jgi:RimJ/RimL family protein N-acetyltransferase
MNIQKQLFVANTICLGPIDHEKDPEIIARWTHDPQYLRLVETAPALPNSSAQVKKKLESLEKQIEENKNLYTFHIRDREDDRLLGFATIRWIEWTHGTGWLHLGIGDSRDWRKGIGTQVLDLLLNYAFNELNLYRLSAIIPEYNAGALRLFEKAGFLLEVRRRQALNRDGRRWDLLMHGLLREDWEAHNAR